MCKRVLAWTILLFVITGCDEPKGSDSASAPPAKKVAIPKPSPPADRLDTAEATDASPQYAYDPTNRRDPFVPFVSIRRLLPDESNAPITPLQTFDLSQLRLIAVIIGKGAPRAMVIAPDGKGYILQKGLKVGKNNGTVVAIRNDAVVVKELYYDLSGEIRENNLEIQVPKREGV